MSTERDAAPNYQRIRSAERLWQAWQSVRRSSLPPLAPRARDDVLAFELRAPAEIERIATELDQRSFDFAPATAVHGAEGEVSSGPIPIADVRARIVQRALLDELQSVDSLRPLLQSPNSFGGIQDRGRGRAVREVLREIQDGKIHWLRTVIPGFFARIPREAALAAIRPHVDGPTGDLLEREVRLEISHAEALGALRERIPDEERTLVQGFCLSSVFANVALSAFDEQMSGRGVRCLRHVDEILFLGSSEQKLMKAYSSAAAILGGLGLSALDPSTGTDEAGRGRADRPFEFLGCSIQRGLVRPSRRATRRLLDAIDRRLARGAPGSGDGGQGPDGDDSLARVLLDVGSVVQGWRQNLDFCDQPFVFCDVNKAITLRLTRYLDDLRAPPGRQRRA